MISDFIVEEPQSTAPLIHTQDADASVNAKLASVGLAAGQADTNEQS